VPSDPSVLKPYGSEGGVVRLDSSAASNCGYARFVAPKAGRVSVTASAPGFAPVSVTVEAFAGGNTPARTRVYAVPPRIATGCTARFLVQMLDSQGHPAWPKGHTSLALDSSSAEVASAMKEMLFNSSFTCMQASVYPGTKVGTTTVTATAPGLVSEPAQFAIVPLAVPAPAPAQPAPSQPAAAATTSGALEERAYRSVSKRFNARRPIRPTRRS
jgi:hypothetical protein